MKSTPRARHWLLAMLASSLLGSAPASAAEAAPESAVRAALLFNFLKFTQWPAVAEGSPRLLVCVASGDPELLAALEAIGGRRVRGRTLFAENFRQQADCDAIYVDSRRRWSQVAETRASPQALTVGGYAGFAADGGMIEIALQEGGARFDINLAEARRAGLRFYPQLLQLARRVLE